MSNYPCVQRINFALKNCPRPEDLVLLLMQDYLALDEAGRSEFAAALMTELASRVCLDRLRTRGL
jgi:hypothetical protein